jgi:PLP dependent protein
VTVDPALVSVNVAEVRARIAAAGGATRVRLVAVTKGFGTEAVRAAIAAGVVDIGESYAQELEQKAAALADVEPASPRWHFVGRVQRNKIRRIAGTVSTWHGIDRLEVGREIARWRPGATVLVQVNVSAEPQKAGCPPSGAGDLVAALSAEGLDVRGLMAVGPAGPPESARPGFRLLSRLADELGLAERSMGMSDDLEVAVEEGATMVRIGRAIFGPRRPRSTG